ncbi:MAG: AhpC/TSA family protein [Acidimicrobiia bacterium]
MADRDLLTLTMSAEHRWMEGWLEGPTFEGSPLQRGARAPEIEVIAGNGTATPITSFWRATPALVMLWRHLGCGCGLDRNGRLQEELPVYEEAGLRVAIVAPGDIERVNHYRDKHEVPVAMYATPDYAAHRAFGLGHWSMEQVLYDAPEEFCDLRADTGKEFRTSRREKGRPLVDDPWMQAAEFVIDPEGWIRVAYYYNYCEDYPDPRIFITAARLIA